MNSTRGIRVLYSLTFTIFHFILWGIISFPINNIVDYKLFIIALLTVLLIQLISKDLSSLIILGLPIAAGVSVLYFIYGKNGMFINTVFIILNTFLLFNKEGERIDYGAYSIKVKKSVYILAAVGLLMFFIEDQLKSTLLRFYMLYLITGIWLLREARNYTYNILKKSVWGNISILLLVLVLTMESIYKIVAVVLNRTLQAFNFIIDKIILFSAIIFVKCFGGVMEFLSSKIRSLKPQSVNLSPAMNKKIDPENLSQLSRSNPLVGGTFKVVIILLLCYMIYRIIKKYRYDKEAEGLEIQESREKIARVGSLEGKSILHKVKDLFQVKDFRQQALDIFKNFQVKTYRKNVFREYMAAQELGEHAGEKLDNIEDTKRLAELYNVSKFSKEEITEHDVSEMKKIFNSIKDDIDKL